MVFMHILGSVPFVVGLKGKEGHPCWNILGTLKKLAIQYLLSLYLVIYAYDESPDEGLQQQILSVPPPPPNGVHEIFGSVPFESLENLLHMKYSICLWERGMARRAEHLSSEKRRSHASSGKCVCLS